MLRVTAELVALAVEETGPGTDVLPADQLLNPIEVCLLGHDRHILLEVVHVQTPGTSPGEQRDLAVVNALAIEWGAYSTSSERVVWAELDVTRPRTPPPHNVSYLRPR